MMNIATAANQDPSAERLTSSGSRTALGSRPQELWRSCDWQNVPVDSDSMPVDRFTHQISDFGLHVNSIAPRRSTGAHCSAEANLYQQSDTGFQGRARQSTWTSRAETSAYFLQHVFALLCEPGRATTAYPARKNALRPWRSVGPGRVQRPWSPAAPVPANIEPHTSPLQLKLTSKRSRRLHP